MDVHTPPMKQAGRKTLTVKPLKTVDLTADVKDSQGTEKHNQMTPRESDQQNPDSRKLQKKQLVLSTKDCKGKKRSERERIKSMDPCETYQPATM